MHSYRADIDGLRAIAVLSVIIHHVDKALMPNGYLGVDLFFVISGYVVTQSLVGREHQRIGSYLLDFYSRRVKRLLPALFLCAIVTFLLIFLFVPPGPPASEFVGTGVAALFGVSNISLFWNANDYFGASAEVNPFTHTWSLGVEEQFYLLYPALLWLAGLASIKMGSLRRFFLIIGFAAFFSLIGYVYLSSRNPNAAFYLMPLRFWELALGALAFGIRVKFAKKDLSVWSRPFSIVSILPLLLLLPALYLRTPWSDNLSIYLVVGLAFVLVLGGDLSSLTRKILTVRVLVFIGLISYSLYLWHWPVLVISRATVGVSEITIPYVLIAMLLMAVLSYRFVEVPLRRLRWSASGGIFLRPISPVVVAVSVATLITAAVSYVGQPMHIQGKIYTGALSPLPSPGDPLFQHDQKYGDFKWSSANCVVHNKFGLKPLDVNECTFGHFDSAQRKFLVIGNSFADAEIEMYKILVNEGLGSVTVTSSWGSAPFPNLNKKKTNEANEYYWNTVIPGLLESMSTGDVVLMVYRGARFSAMKNRKTIGRAIERMRKQLVDFVELMSTRGIHVVYQAELPFMVEANCSPDESISQWWDVAGAEKCNYHTRELTLRRRRLFQEMLLQEQARHENFSVLDLMDVYCPGEKCKFSNDDGVMLYRDASGHPSAEASRLAQPYLLRHVQKILSQSQPN